MKTNNYESPSVSTMEVLSESVLCASGYELSESSYIMPWEKDNEFIEGF